MVEVGVCVHRSAEISPSGPWGCPGGQGLPPRTGRITAIKVGPEDLLKEDLPPDCSLTTCRSDLPGLCARRPVEWGLPDRTRGGQQAPSLHVLSHLQTLPPSAP